MKAFAHAAKGIGLLFILLTHHSVASELTVVNRDTDWVVNDSQTITNQHILLDGDLILNSGGHLKLVGCVVEVQGTHSREHVVDWRGGKLTTENTTIGGTLVGDKAVHTVFHVYDGHWFATDTIVQYSYGISFGKDPRKPSVLRATRMKAGPRPDAILLANYGNVELVDSDFPIAVGVFADAGGGVVLDLPVGKSIDKVFDDSVIPQCTYRAKLTRHRVAGPWFLFIRSIQPEDKAPPYKVVLDDCPKVLVSVLSWNVVADLRIDRTLEAPIQVGNTIIKRGKSIPEITMWSFYGGGPKYDLTIRGQDVRIAEFMQRGGRAKIIGNHESDKPLTMGCTTLEMSKDANLELTDIHLGRPLNWKPSPSMGEANVSGESFLLAHRCTAHNVIFRTEDSGQVQANLVATSGTIGKRQNGGSILITGPDREDSTSGKRKNE